MNLEQIVSELKKERDDLNRAIAALEGIGGKRSQAAKASEKGSLAKPLGKRRGGLSAGSQACEGGLDKKVVNRSILVTEI